MITERGQEGPYMGTRGRETQDMGIQVWHYPPSKQAWPAPYNIQWAMGRGGWALWRPQGTWRQGRWPPGRCPFRDHWWIRDLGPPWRIRGLGRPWRVQVIQADQGTPWAMVGSPPQNVLGEVHNLWGTLWSGLCELLERSGLWSGLCELLERSGLWSGLCELLERSGLWSGLCEHLERSGPCELLERSGLWSGLGELLERSGLLGALGQHGL